LAPLRFWLTVLVKCSGAFLSREPVIVMFALQGFGSDISLFTIATVSSASCDCVLSESFAPG